MIDRDWKSVKYGTPEPFDLVQLALKRGAVVTGWWTGMGWDGRRLKEDDEVLAYKKVDWQTNNHGHSIRDTRR